MDIATIQVYSRHSSNAILTYVQQAPVDMLPSTTLSATAGTNTRHVANGMLPSTKLVDIEDLRADIQMIKDLLVTTFSKDNDVVDADVVPFTMAETVGTESRLATSSATPPEAPIAPMAPFEKPADKLAQYVEGRTSNVIHLISGAPNATDRFASVCGWKFAYAISECDCLNEFPDDHGFRLCLKRLPILRGSNGELVESESSDSE